MKTLDGKVALVTGGSRGAGRGIAIELGAAGAHVYVTARTTRDRQSEYGRPETIEETAELITEAGGAATAIAVDHLEPPQVERLVETIERESGRLDILVNDIWGGEKLFEWDTKLWEHDLDNGLRLFRLAVDTHLITSHFALPLLIRRPGGLVVEMTDGTAEYNAETYRVSAFYDLAKWAVIRLAWSQGHELAGFGCTAVALTPGWMRSEMMLENYGVTEENWRDVLDRPFEPPYPDPGHFGISETPRFTGRAVVALAADPDVARWNQASLSAGQLARDYGFVDLDGSAPDAWRYMVEVQDPGKPPDPAPYRQPPDPVDGPTVEVRPAGSQDAPAVAEIWQLGWRDGHLGSVPPELTAARTPDTFRTRAAQRVGYTTVAVVDGQVAGFVMVAGSEVEQVYVSARHRGAGVADVLMGEAERQIKAAGHTSAWLAVVAGNARARRFYERAGWTDDGPFDYLAASEGGQIVVPSHRYVKTL